MLKLLPASLGVSLFSACFYPPLHHNDNKERLRTMVRGLAQNVIKRFQLTAKNVIVVLNTSLFVVTDV